MTFQKLEEALVAVSSKTHRKFPPEKEEMPYIIWDHDGQNGGLYGDGKVTKQILEGTIDLFTETEDDPMFNQIQQSLNAAGIAFRYNSTQSDAATGVSHHEWVWNIPVEV